MTAPGAPDGTAKVRSVAQAFAILRQLAAGEALTLSEIGRATAISPSSCHGLLATLLAEGAVQRLPGRRYALAPGWAGLAALAPQGPARVIALARPLLARFARAHDVTVGLWQRMADDRLVLVALGESGAATRIHMVEGQRQPLAGGSIGRALAAHEGLDDAELAARFAAARWRHPLAEAQWRAQVAQAARQGFGLDDGYAHPGICSVGVVAASARPVLFLTASFFAGTRDAPAITAIGAALAVMARGHPFSAG